MNDPATANHELRAVDVAFQDVVFTNQILNREKAESNSIGTNALEAARRFGLFVGLDVPGTTHWGLNE